jgi:hypothetical protein
MRARCGPQLGSDTDPEIGSDDLRPYFPWPAPSTMVTMMGRHRAQALGLGVLIASASLLGGTAIAADTVDVGGSAVAYERSFAEDAESDSARRTTYYDADTLVAAAWDEDADGSDDLWMQVDPDWYVERVAADRDGDGIAESVVTVDHDGKSTVDAMPLEESSTGSPMVLVAIGAVLAAVAIGSAVWLARRRKGGITAMLLVLALAAVAVPADAADPLWDEDCNLDSARFDDEWEKYSDIDDERVESPSSEARQLSDAVEEAMALMLQVYELEMDLEMEGQVVEALRVYRAQLSRNQGRNLIRAFIRLTMLTGETIKGAVNLGSSIPKLGGTVLETIGASLKISDHFQPTHSDQKKTVRNAVNGVRWSVFKDTLESMGDPKSVVTTLLTSSMEEVNNLADLPEWKISDAEFQVLRDQHLKSKALDTVMLEAERDQASRRDLLELVQEELESVLAEADTQRAAEKERVRAFLIAQCEKERDQESTTTSSDVAYAPIGVHVDVGAEDTAVADQYVDSFFQLWPAPEAEGDVPPLATPRLSGGTFDIAFDFEAMTVSGSFDLAYERGDVEELLCKGSPEAFSGTARGIFKDLPIRKAETSETPPSDWGLPAEDWWPMEADGWYVGGSFPVELAMSGVVVMSCGLSDDGTTYNETPFDLAATFTSWMKMTVDMARNQGADHKTLAFVNLHTNTNESSTAKPYWRHSFTWSQTIERPIPDPLG